MLFFTSSVTDNQFDTVQAVLCSSFKAEHLAHVMPSTVFQSSLNSNPRNGFVKTSATMSAGDVTVPQLVGDQETTDVDCSGSLCTGFLPMSFKLNGAGIVLAQDVVVPKVVEVLIFGLIHMVTLFVWEVFAPQVAWQCVVDANWLSLS